MHWFNTREDYPLLFNINIGKNFFFEKEFEIIVIVIIIINIGTVGCILCPYGMTNAECELFFQSLKALKNVGVSGCI